MRKIVFIAILLVTGLFTACTDSSEEMLNQPQQIDVEEMSTGGQGSGIHDPDPEPVDPKEGNQKVDN
ncbi:hypothetical protein [Tenacibaculum xiamenense]|uniref:hypothetical protein n=1 Tax=Tenacibaculum xiamenense TaxID=1261553 RepID=UPI003895B69F